MTPSFAQISANVVLGKDVRLTGFCNLYGCVIGDECLIGPFVEIQCDAQLGKRVKVQSHSFICSGVRLEDEVFVGHGVMFINDRFPRATTTSGKLKRGDDWVCEPTVVKRRASIGSNATILCGVTIGEGAIVGAGSVVTRDVPPQTVVAGNPARVIRRVHPEDEQGGPRPNDLSSAPARGVPFLNLPQQHAELKQELLAVVEQAIDRAGFIGGPLVARFEQDFAQATGSGYCVGVGSGTDALRFALLALGVGPGTSVITVPNTFVATAASITQAGGAVEFVDVDPDTCLMDPGSLEDHLKRRMALLCSGPRPVAVLPVHLYGQCADMDAIVAIARRYGLKVLEDAAQAHGSTYRGRPAGSLGDAAAFSFYPGKNLGACGEGGAVTTNDPEVQRQVLLLRDHGRSDKYVHVLEGYNGRLDAIQAGWLAVKLRYLPQWNEQRRQLASSYDAALALLPSLRPVKVQPWNRSCYHLYVIRSAQRERLQMSLGDRGIASGIHYPVPLHRQPCYRRLDLPPGRFPHAERSCAEVLSLPLFPEMEAAQLQLVIEALKSFEQEQACAGQDKDLAALRDWTKQGGGMEVRHGRVLVTGGAGFIGSHLVEYLLSRDNEVVVVDDFSSGSPDNLAHLQSLGALRVVKADVRDEQAVSQVMQGAHWVFHLATRNVRSSLVRPSTVHEVNTTGTLNVLKAAAAARARRLLYCSSSEVNGTADVVPMPEDYSYRPETIYGASKLAGEYYAQVFHRSGWLPTVVARPHNNYGPREHYQGNKGEVIPRFILWGLAGQPLRIYGDGRQTRDFTYVTETVAILVRLLECDRAMGQTFNVCRGEEVSIGELAHLIRELTGGTSPIEHLPGRPSDVLRLFGDPSRLRGVLGSSPTISIREGLERTVAWFRANVPLDDFTLASLDVNSWSHERAEPWLEKLVPGHKAA